MTVYLYHTDQLPQQVSSKGFTLPSANLFALVPPQAAQLLGCAPNLVDVMATGEGYVVYTIFDSEQEANPVATHAVAELTGTDFDVTNEDDLLRGPVLIVR